MAEFLIKAQPHWLDKYTEEEALKLFPHVTSESYRSHTTKGDIICVRPDGWKWGRCECLPEYIVVTIPGLAVDRAYEGQLFSQILSKRGDEWVPKLLKVRKFNVPTLVINTLVSLKQSVVTQTKAQIIDTLEEKTS